MPNENLQNFLNTLVNMPVAERQNCAVIVVPDESYPTNFKSISTLISQFQIHQSEFLNLEDLGKELATAVSPVICIVPASTFSKNSFGGIGALVYKL